MNFLRLLMCLGCLLQAAQLFGEVRYLSEPKAMKFEILGKCDSLHYEAALADKATYIVGGKKLFAETPVCEDETRLRIQRCVCHCDKKASAAIMPSAKQSAPPYLACLRIR